MMPSAWCTSSSRFTSEPRRGSVFSLEVIEERPGFLLFRAQGRDVESLFAAEAGGHRWQRVPPSEKRGRVHTSTITVAVLPEPSERSLRIPATDLDETFTGGSGKGGQHQNKRSTAVVLVHKPSGIGVRIEGRSQHANRRTAMDILRARLRAHLDSAASLGHNEKRRAQVGSGMRGDKVRTVQVRNGLVVDHRSGKKMPYRRYVRGHIRELL